MGHRVQRDCLDRYLCFVRRRRIAAGGEGGDSGKGDKETDGSVHTSSVSGSKQTLETVTTFTTEEKAYLIARNNPALQQRVNDWLGAAQKDGTYARIAQQWLGRVVGP